MRRAGAPLAVALPALLLVAPLRQWIESRMLLHMLLEFPLLLLAGWCAARWWLGHPRARPMLRITRMLDWHGWTTLTLVSSVALVWMLPSALDAALLWPALNLGKLASWWLAGWLLAGAWRRIDPELVLFFLGNLAWMTATAGLLYLDAPARLCVNYLQDDQRHAGIGLVLLAVLLGVLAIVRAVAEGGASPGTAPAQPQCAPGRRS